MASKPGERKLQILQMVAQMLEQPKIEKITTAALAAKLDISEAALYRHFASKAQMYEGLIEFIEQTLFGMINKITQDEKSGTQQVDEILSLLLGFSQQNRGMVRVLIGDALVNENERLQERINKVLDRLEATLKQSIRMAATQGEMGDSIDVGAYANVMICFVIGRWQQFSKSGFVREPKMQWTVQRKILLTMMNRGS
jgi:TetR/AcrR family transcriptional regulator